jgi:hypothetical protein
MVDNIKPGVTQTVYFTAFTSNLPQGAMVQLHAYVNGQEVNIPSETISQLTSEGVGVASAVPGQIAQSHGVSVVAWKVDVNGVYSNYVTTTIQLPDPTAPLNNPTATPYDNYPTPTPPPSDEVTKILIGGLDFNSFGYIGAFIMGIIGPVLVVKTRKK